MRRLKSSDSEEIFTDKAGGERQSDHGEGFKGEKYPCGRIHVARPGKIAEFFHRTHAVRQISCRQEKGRLGHRMRDDMKKRSFHPECRRKAESHKDIADLGRGAEGRHSEDIVLTDRTYGADQYSERS